MIEALSWDTARMALLQSWLQATAAVERATDMALQSQLALEWGLTSTLPQAVDKLRAVIHAQRQSPADIGGGGAKLGLKPLGNGLQGREADLDTVTLNA